MVRRQQQPLTLPRAGGTGRRGLGGAAGPLQIPHPHVRAPAKKEALAVLCDSPREKQRRREVILSGLLAKRPGGAFRALSPRRAPSTPRLPLRDTSAPGVPRDPMLCSEAESKQPPDSKPPQGTTSGRRGTRPLCLRCSTPSRPFCPQHPPPSNKRGRGSCPPRPVKRTRLRQRKVSLLRLTRFSPFNGRSWRIGVSGETTVHQLLPARTTAKPKLSTNPQSPS